MDWWILRESNWLLWSTTYFCNNVKANICNFAKQGLCDYLSVTYLWLSSMNYTSSVAQEKKVVQLLKTMNLLTSLGLIIHTTKSVFQPV